ncbi:MAG: PilZ domain-containing protein [Spirochaetales bacterium]|nr:PilZ domain-containing protein [Spirochaetales bacterium]
MAVITSQQISRYFDQFKNTEVTFTKDVIRATLLSPKNVQLRCLGYQWPVILYSSSLLGAKIIANVSGPLKEVTQKANGLVQLRYSFIQRDKVDPLSFFLNAKITAFHPYNPTQTELNFLNLTFTNRPPDELIQRLGELIEANLAFQQRKEERVSASPEILAQLGFEPKGTTIFIENMPRKCLLRDLSFSGAKVIIMGIAPFLVNKKGTFRIVLTDSEGHIDLPATVVRFEQVQGRQDLAAFALKFDDEAVPTEYKMRLSAFLKTIKKPKNAQQVEPAPTE